MSITTTNQRFDSAQAAEYLGIQAQTLAAWRMTGRHKIPYIKMGRRVVYLQSDLDAYLSSHRVDFSK
jgi:excisionase family DNA binding protein